MADTIEGLAVALGAVACLALVVIGPASCIQGLERERTEQVKAACAGDMTEAARASACTLALATKRPM